MLERILNKLWVLQIQFFFYYMEFPLFKITLQYKYNRSLEAPHIYYTKYVHDGYTFFGIKEGPVKAIMCFANADKTTGLLLCPLLQQHIFAFSSLPDILFCSWERGK